MDDEKKQLHRIYQVGGRSFPIYREYDKQLGGSYPVYPDFEKAPQFTEEGEPFVTAVQDSCPYSKARKTEEEPPLDCSGCAYFFREHTAYDPIGICRNQKRSKGSGNRTKQDKRNRDKEQEIKNEEEK